MAYYGGANTFGGFPGGYSQTPGGIPNANLGVGGSGAVHTIGTNLPSVNPNNYPGAVHFGPSSTFVGQGYGQFPAGAGVMDPSLGATGGLNYNPNLGLGGANFNQNLGLGGGANLNPNLGLGGANLNPNLGLGGGANFYGQ